MTLLGLALGEAVRARALELGFDAVALGPAGPPEHAAAFERWLANDNFDADGRQKQRLEALREAPAAVPPATA